MQKIQGDRYSAVNLLNINNWINTIEFRIPNGKINPDVWVENARLFGRIVQILQRLAEIEKKPITEWSKEDTRLLELKKLLKEQMTEHKKNGSIIRIIYNIKCYNKKQLW